MPTGPGELLLDVAEGGDLASLMAAVRDSVRAWIGAGPVFLATADPATGAITGGFTFDIPHEAAAAFSLIESAGHDIGSFAELAGSRSAVGSLFTATDARPERSERWREVISPLRWGDELRAVVRTQDTTWGYLCVHREATERPFAPRELVQLGRLLPAIALAMRTAAGISSGHGGELATGVVLADERGRVAGLTGAAGQWLDELGPRPPDGLPLVLDAVVRSVLDRGAPASVTVVTRRGRLGLVEAAPLVDSPRPGVAIVLASAPAPQRLAHLAAATGLTAREREIVACVLDGLDTRAIAERLVISPHTVQAHLTAAFGKTGLRSRRELISRLAGRP